MTSSIYAHVSQVSTMRAAQRREQLQATCNTVLLALSALFLAMILSRSPPQRHRPLGQLSDAVPGLPEVLFTNPETGKAGEWESMGEGPLPLWYHHPTGRAWADVSVSLDQDLLFVEQVTGGVGIRGMWDVGELLGSGLVVKFRVLGPKVLLVAQQLAQARIARCAIHRQQ
eukprot:COSAG02_NODE_1521_length_12162_cov_3.464147_8_plen_171_part_00